MIINQNALTRCRGILLSKLPSESFLNIEGLLPFGFAQGRLAALLAMTGDGRQRTEDRGQKTEDRRQRTEDRGRMVNIEYRTRNIE